LQSNPCTQSVSLSQSHVPTTPLAREKSALLPSLSCVVVSLRPSDAQTFLPSFLSFFLPPFSLSSLFVSVCYAASHHRLHANFVRSYLCSSWPVFARTLVCPFVSCSLQSLFPLLCISFLLFSDERKRMHVHPHALSCSIISSHSFRVLRV